MELKNIGQTREIDGYPIFNAKFSFPLSMTTVTLCCADALQFTPRRYALTDGNRVTLGSETYSSDHKGQLPSWRIVNENSLCFDIAWCGGWHADIQPQGRMTELKVSLTPVETQLTLEPNEKIVGPKLSLALFPETQDVAFRKAYFTTKQKKAEPVWNMPSPMSARP